ncbi:MAG TPA: hypothetical protein VGB59_03500 [Allosphingosinicella sp.]|jgi:hypothetical protein
MIPTPGSEFLLRLETNEMIERERLAALLSQIEDVIRGSLPGGSRAYLLIGAFRRGSIELFLGIGAIATTVVMQLPSFLVDLKKLASDRRAEPNPFAVALADVMAFDGTSSVDFVHKDKTVTIHKSEVPFVQRLSFGRDLANNRAQAIRPEELQPREEADPENGQVEDEDQDWVPTLEAQDHPPREARAAQSGYISSITMVGEFEKAREHDGSTEIRFVPRDSTFAPYFVVTSNAYGDDPAEFVLYEVTGNVTIDGDGPGSIEVLDVLPPGDALLTLRT